MSRVTSDVKFTS